MSATSIAEPATTDMEPSHDERSRPVHDTWVIAKRGLKHMRRQPEALADATFQPIMFVLLFAYVFGGAIAIPGAEDDPGAYREFLMGGIFAQTLSFGVFGVAMALAADFNNGAMDRFRSLPIARGSVLAGHSLANLIRAAIPIVLMSLTGLIVGWQPRGSFFDTIAAYALMLAFTFAMIWIGVLLASLVRTPEAVQGVAFVAIFPLTFVASTFVPTSTLPGILKTIAEWNPISSVANALRELFNNPGTVVPADAPWPLHHSIAYTLIWTVLIIVITAPLAIRAYQRSIGD
ncbi:MAG: ABC transporter permease [Solirubrobacteraceae bacterium]|nr:ABC transporter permease [Solirubrobacteraceae bacterium]